MKVMLKDGSSMEFENGVSVLDVAKAISEGLARAACAAKVNGEVVDIRTELDGDCELEILTFRDEEGKKATIEKTMTLFVNEPYYPDMSEDMMMDGMEEESKGFPWWGTALIVVAVAAAAVTVVIVIRKKKKAKRLAQEELEVIELLEDKESAE